MKLQRSKRMYRSLLRDTLLSCISSGFSVYPPSFDLNTESSKVPQVNMHEDCELGDGHRYESLGTLPRSTYIPGQSVERAKLSIRLISHRQRNQYQMEKQSRASQRYRPRTTA